MNIPKHQNKSSALKPSSRYVSGGISDVFEKRIGWWERRVLDIGNSITDITIEIDGRTHQRPDLISFEYYNTSRFVWLILQYNNIVDVTTEFISGKTIKIPPPDLVFYKVLN